MLIDFELTPIGKVLPWGTPDNPGLSWFGLTEGRYWINAGVDTLFEYNERFRQNNTNRYCDYYVARIFEDLMEMIPSILEAVPQDLTKYITGDSGREWAKTYRSWSAQNLTAVAGDEAWSVSDRANLLTCSRCLDCSYLSPSTSILIWSDDLNVHIEWENGDKLIDGELVWSAVSGSFHLPREEFVQEVSAFHANLFEQMKLRIDQVAEGALNPSIQINLPGVIAENERRRDGLAQTLTKRSGTSWDEIRSAVLKISSGEAW